MQSIKDTVTSVMQDLRQKKNTGLRGLQPEDSLKKILTRKELAHVKFHYFRKGILGLWVDSSSWLYSLNLRKEKLIAGAGAKSCGIKEIRLRIGGLE